jgi:hypothetical protein
MYAAQHASATGLVHTPFEMLQCLEFRPRLLRLVMGNHALLLEVLQRCINVAL